MITLRSVQLKNFLSHKNTELKFHSGQKLLIDGESGSGKSSIIEAIIWVLYGKGRTDNKNLIRRGSSKAVVVLELLDDDKKIYSVERSVDKKGKQTISVKEDDKPILSTGVKGNQEYIEQTILKSSYLLFINSIIYLQDSIDTFVRQTAAKKKDILLEIVNASGYDEWLKKVKESLNDIKLQHAADDGKIEQLQQQLDDLKIRTENIEELRKEKASIEEKLEKLKKLKEEYTKDKEIKQGELADIDRNISEYEALKKDAESIEIEIKQIQSTIPEDIIDTTKDQKIIEVLPKKEKELNELQDKKSEVLSWDSSRLQIMSDMPTDYGYDKQILEVNSEIIETMKEESPTCKKCGTPYEEHEAKKNERIAKLSEKLKSIQEEKDNDDKKKADLEKELEGIGERPVVDEGRIAALKTEITQLRTIKDRVDRAEQEQSKTKEAKNSILILKEKLQFVIKKKDEINIDSNKKLEIQKEFDSIMSKMRTIEVSENTYSGQLLVSVNNKIAVCEENERKTKEYEAEIEEIKKNSKDIKEKIESLELLKGAFSQNGIRAMVIDYVLPQLEDSINKILETLSDFQVKINTQKQGATEETVLEGLFIDVINPQGEVFDYENFSGGEKVKVSMSINEALAELSKVNFRIMDETVVSLDNDSTQKFLEALTSIQEKVGQVVCISHIPEVKDIFEDRLVVKKINGISKTE